MFEVKNVLWCIALIFLSSALVDACAVHASEPVSIDLTVDRIYDSNLFRLPDNVDLETIIGNSRADDVINRFGARLSWDVPLSLQRVTGSADFIANRFEHNDRLNNDNLNTMLGWEGEFAKTWEGHGLWRREQALASFADFEGGKRDIINRDRIEVGLGRQIASHWKMLGQWERDTYAHSLASQQYNDRRAVGMRLSIIGQSAAGSEMKVSISSRTVDFVNWTWVPGSAQDDSLREDALGFYLRWSITDTTTAEAEARTEQVTTDHLPQSNFSGSTYDMALVWNDDGVFNWRAAIWSKIDTLESTYANYVLRQGGRFTMQWSVRSAWRVQSKVSHEWLDYKGGGSAHREDWLDDVSLSLAYTPLRDTMFRLTYSTSTRDSSATLSDYRGRSFRLEVKVHWE